MPQDHLQRLSVPFKHGKKEKRQHHKDHGHSGQGHVAGLTDKKKERQSNKECSSETEDLTLCEVQKELALDPRQISGHIGV